jgi:benzoyl-CoA reductase subunit B
MVDWLACKPYWKQEYSIALKNDILLKLCRQWKADAAVLHYNRGCEMMSQSVPETRSALMDAGFPVFTYEADMADWRSFDEARIRARIDAFMEGLGLQKLEA